MVGADAWSSLQRFMGGRSQLTSPDRQLLRAVLSPSNRMLGIDDARGLLRLYVKAINHGWQES